MSRGREMRTVFAADAYHDHCENITVQLNPIVTSVENLRVDCKFVQTPSTYARPLADH
jgi:hypothetical protein